MDAERRTSKTPKGDREQLQRIRGELCGFVDRTPGAIRHNPETHRFEIDTTVINEGGLSSQFAMLYQDNTEALVDDVMFYRFIRAANVYRETIGNIARRSIAEQDFVVYMEYLINTPRTSEERVLIEAVGYQPLDEETREKIIRGLGFLFGTPSNTLPFWKSYQPRFSPEYKQYFLRNYRDEYLYPMEYDPGDPESIRKAFIEKAARGFASVLDIPQDEIRDDLPIPEDVEYVSSPSKDESDFEIKITEGVNDILTRLEPTERRLIMLLFGLQDGVARTIAEISKIMGIPMDEVKELEAQVFEKLRKREQ